MRRAVARYGQVTGVADGIASIQNDFDMAKQSRHRRQPTGVTWSGSGADRHYQTESSYFRMVEAAREFDRNDAVVGQGVTRLVDNVLQQGIGVDPDTGNAALDTLLREKWDEWGENPDACDSRSMNTFHGLSRLMLRHVVVDGDVLALPLENGTIQGIENHRLRTPSGTKKNVVLGVHIDENQRPIEYWLTKADTGVMGSVKLVSDVQQYAARDAQGNRQVFHILNPKRLSQTRGVTAFAPIADMVGMLGDLQFAKLIQAQVASCFAVLRKRPEQFGGGAPAALGSKSDETGEDGMVITLEGVGPGMVVTGAPGEELTGFSPNIPNQEFFEHSFQILTFIGLNLGLPAVVLLLDMRQTNFSGYRGAIDQMREGLKSIQAFMIALWYRPVYEWQVRRLMAMDEEVRSAVRAAGPDVRPLRHGWQPPKWNYIEPTKDAGADDLIISKRLNTRRAVLGSRGLDIESVDRDLVADNVRLIKACIMAAGEINVEYPEAGVGWREILGGDGKNVGVKPQRAQSEEEGDGTDGMGEEEGAKGGNGEESVKGGKGEEKQSGRNEWKEAGDGEDAEQE